jgi:hypothetical protein
MLITKSYKFKKENKMAKKKQVPFTNLTKEVFKQESFNEIATEISLKHQLISDLTGLPTWDVNSAPTYIWELADHLLSCGWKQ